MRLELVCALLVIAVVTIGTSAEDIMPMMTSGAFAMLSTMMMGGALEILSTMMCRAC